MDGCSGVGSDEMVVKFVGGIVAGPEVGLVVVGVVAIVVVVGVVHM